MHGTFERVLVSLEERSMIEGRLVTLGERLSVPEVSRLVSIGIHRALEFIRYRESIKRSVKTGVKWLEELGDSSVVTQVVEFSIQTKERLQNIVPYLKEAGEDLAVEIMDQVLETGLAVKEVFEDRIKSRRIFIEKIGEEKAFRFFEHIKETGENLDKIVRLLDGESNGTIKTLVCSALKQKCSFKSVFNKFKIQQVNDMLSSGREAYRRNMGEPKQPILGRKRKKKEDRFKHKKGKNPQSRARRKGCNDFHRAEKFFSL